MALEIHHDAQANRFTAMVDGHRCVVDYLLSQQVMSIIHTGVPEAVGGRGIAAELTKFVLDTARAAGLKIIPVCSYTAAYIRRHPEYADLA